jgi:MFS family permease
MCFALFLVEGSVLDWSAVFLNELPGMDPARAGLGYAAFSLTMTIGRLTGDTVVARLGGVAVVVIGAVLAASGLLLTTLTSALPVALIGYALVGAGCANIVPVLYSTLARQTTMAESLAVPAVTTIGYAGVLIGPALIGLVAAASSLSIAFLLLAAMLVVIALAGPRLLV